MNQKPSLLIIGNSNVGKSTVTKLLLPNPKKFKGKTGKTPGSTLLIKSISQPGLPFQIVDLPGFGFMKRSSRRREEHVKKKIVEHIEKEHKKYFLGLVIINIQRIEDELEKYYFKNKETIPLSFELISFLREFDIPILILINKIDKLSNIDVKKNINLFVDSAGDFRLNMIHLDKFGNTHDSNIPYLEFSALKKINLDKLKKFIHSSLKNKL